MGHSYVLGVKGNHRFNSWSMRPAVAGEVKDIAASLPLEAWQRLSGETSTKGERFYD